MKTSRRSFLQFGNKQQHSVISKAQSCNIETKAPAHVGCTSKNKLRAER